MANNTDAFIDKFITKFKENPCPIVCDKDWEILLNDIKTTHTIKGVDYKCGKIKYFKPIFDAFVEKQNELYLADRSTRMMSGWQVNWLKHIGLDIDVIIQLPLFKVSPNWIKLAHSELILTPDNIEKKLGLPRKHYSAVEKLKSYLTTPPVQFVYGLESQHNQTLLVKLIEICLDYAKGLKTNFDFQLDMINLEKNMIDEYKKINTHQVMKIKEWSKVSLRERKIAINIHDPIQCDSLISDIKILKEENTKHIKMIEEKKNEVLKLHLVLKQLREKRKKDSASMQCEISIHKQEFDGIKGKYDTLLVEIKSLKDENKKQSSDYQWAVKSLSTLNAKYHNNKEELQKALHDVSILKKEISIRDERIGDLMVTLKALRSEGMEIKLDGKTYNKTDITNFQKTINQQTILLNERDGIVERLQKKIFGLKQLFKSRQDETICDNNLEWDGIIPINYWKIQDANAGLFLDIDSPYLLRVNDTKKIIEDLIRHKDEIYPSEFYNPRCINYKGHKLLPETLEYISRDLFEPYEDIDWFNLYKITGDDNIAWSFLNNHDIVIKKSSNDSSGQSSQPGPIDFVKKKKKREIESCKLFCGPLLDNKLPINVDLHMIMHHRIT